MFKVVKLAVALSISCSLFSFCHKALADIPLIVFSADGAFLGEVSDDNFNDNSICNRFGKYGDRFSNMSMLNRFSDYGDQFSDISAYNPNAQSPPALIQDRQIVAFITKNRRITGGIDPDFFFYRVCGR
jgi:hypothetical protein